MAHIFTALNSIADKRLTRESLDAAIHVWDASDLRTGSLSSIICSNNTCRALLKKEALLVMQVGLPDKFLESSAVSNKELKDSLHAVYSLCDQFPDSFFFSSISFGSSLTNFNVLVLRTQTEDYVP